jgi:hypothetical protein
MMDYFLKCNNMLGAFKYDNSSLKNPQINIFKSTNGQKEYILERMVLALYLHMQKE